MANPFPSYYRPFTSALREQFHSRKESLNHVTCNAPLLDFLNLNPQTTLPLLKERMKFFEPYNWALTPRNSPPPQPGPLQGIPFLFDYRVSEKKVEELWKLGAIPLAMGDFAELPLSPYNPDHTLGKGLAGLGAAVSSGISAFTLLSPGEPGENLTFPGAAEVKLPKENWLGLFSGMKLQARNSFDILTLLERLDPWKKDLPLFGLAFEGLEGPELLFKGNQLVSPVFSSQPHPISEFVEARFKRMMCIHSKKVSEDQVFISPSHYHFPWPRTGSPEYFPLEASPEAYTEGVVRVGVLSGFPVGVKVAIPRSQEMNELRSRFLLARLLRYLFLLEAFSLKGDLPVHFIKYF